MKGTKLDCLFLKLSVGEKLHLECLSGKGGQNIILLFELLITCTNLCFAIPKPIFIFTSWFLFTVYVTYYC